MGPTFTGTLTGAISNFTTLLKTTGSSASGGQFLQNDTNAGGQTWQIGPGAGSGSPNEWNIYNQGTTTTVFKLGKTGTVSFPGALTYGGVTLSNSVTGTGSMVLSASPTFTGTPKFAGATSGTIGLVATAIAGTNTLTLPAETGTLRSTVSTGTVLQVVNYQTGTLATGTTQIPVDNTIPQNTEGTEFMSLAITPKSATSKLKIEVVAQFSGDTTSSSPTVALFQDSTANALAAAAVGSLQYIGDKVFTHYMTSPGTGTYTFKVRIGQNFAGTITFNGSGSAGLFGGTTPSSITITEVVP
jgi:hypothetical protein